MKGDNRVSLSAAAVIALVCAAAYWNSFRGIYVYDDKGSITDNPTIRTLWPLSVALSPHFADGSTADGRPVLNLSLALNYAVSGTGIWSYHAVNLLIHILCGWILFGILRRIFASDAVPAFFREAAVPLACAIAILWGVHPLQTESVTYVVQRAESLSVLFYLWTLYGFIRGAESGRPFWWFASSVAACFLGVGTKETVVTAPLMTLLYDRTFVAGTFGAALRRRWPFYAALIASWVPLAWLMFGTDSRGGTAGFGTGTSAWVYALTQCEAVVRYLRLSFWPADQVFDYGRYRVTDWRQVWPQVVLLAGLGVATFWALWRKPVLGFALCAILLVLAPTSSLVPIPNQTMAEHRMYLPLAGVAALFVASVYFLLRRRSWFVLVGVAVALAVATIRRNEIYRSELGLWQDTVAKWPWSARGHRNLAGFLVEEGRLREALPHYLAIARIEPKYPDIYTKIGSLLLQLGDVSEARKAFEGAVRQAPQSPAARANLGNVLLQLGRMGEADVQLAEAVRLGPRNGQAQGAYGMLLIVKGRPDEALGYFQKAVELEPKSAECRNNLGVTLVRLGRREEAVEQFREAVRLDPNYEQARRNLRQYEPAQPPDGG